MYFSVELCEQFSNCDYWTWKGNGNGCWLKTSMEGKRQQSGSYSGRKKCNKRGKALLL